MTYQSLKFHGKSTVNFIIFIVVITFLICFCSFKPKTDRIIKNNDYFNPNYHFLYPKFPIFSVFSYNITKYPSFLLSYSQNFETSFPNTPKRTYEMLYWIRITEYSLFKVFLDSPLYHVSDPNKADIFYISTFFSTNLRKAYSLRLKNKLDVFSIYIKPHIIKLPFYERYSTSDHMVIQHFPGIFIFNVKNDSIPDEIFQFSSEHVKWTEDSIWKKSRKAILPVSSHLSHYKGNEQKKYLASFIGSVVDVQPGATIRSIFFNYIEKNPIQDSYIYRIVRSHTPGEHYRPELHSKIPRQSRVCIHVCGDVPSGKRLYDAIQSQCPLIVLSDELLLPFEGLFFDPKRFINQIPMYHPEFIPSAINLMNDRIIENQKKISDFISKLTTVRLDQKTACLGNPGEFSWGFLWSTFIRQAYVASFQRKKLLSQDVYWDPKPENLPMNWEGVQDERFGPNNEESWNTF